MVKQSVYRFKIGDILNTTEIISQIIMLKKDKKCTNGYSNQKAYVVKCTKCNGEYEINETNLNKQLYCPICINKKVIKGINDIATTHPHLVEYFINKEDSYIYTYSSCKKVELICPNCKNHKKMTLNKLTSRHFSCGHCGDGFPYTEKLFSNVLSKIRIKPTTQFKPKWSSGKSYDFYIENLNCIIETHGMQHYKNTFARIGGRTLEEEQANDKLKRELALANGIEHYIELDCRFSTLEHIKNSIMTSELPALLNFKEEDIDWIECERLSINSSKVIKACDIWNKGNYYVDDIAEICSIDRATARKYLNIGTSIGLCDYSIEKSKRFGIEKRAKNVVKKILNIETGLIFNSAKELQEKSEEIFGIKLNGYNIRAVCNGVREHHRNLHFRYIESK